MRATNSLARWGLAACLIGSGSSAVLRAQETGFIKEAKLRFAYDFTSNTAKDHLRRSTQGIGLNLGYALGAAGKIGVEIGYTYKTGDEYLAMADGSKVPTGKNPLNATPDFSQSAEEKRNELSGLTVRLSYQNKINDSWDYQGGIQMGGKFKHQYVGDVRSTNWSNTAPNNATSWRDVYNGTPVEGGVNISPYLGGTYRFDKDSSLEMNILFLRYNAIEYKHYAGTASTYDASGLGPISATDASWRYDSLVKSSRTAPHIEFAYVFHF